GADSRHSSHSVGRQSAPGVSGAAARTHGARYSGMSDSANRSARGFLSLDRMVHEPARLAILTVLSGAESVEFRFLEAVTGLTRGNISSHAAKLEEAGYITISKEFRGRTPVTSYSISEQGSKALAAYRAQLSATMQLES